MAVWHLSPLRVVDRFNFDPTAGGVHRDIPIFCNEFERTSVAENVGLRVVVTDRTPDRIGVFADFVVSDPYLECHKGIVAFGRLPCHPFPGW